MNTVPIANCFICGPQNRETKLGNETKWGGLQQLEEIGKWRHKLRRKWPALIGIIPIQCPDPWLHPTKKFRPIATPDKE